MHALSSTAFMRKAVLPPETDVAIVASSFHRRRHDRAALDRVKVRFIPDSAGRSKDELHARTLLGCRNGLRRAKGWVKTRVVDLSAIG